MSETLGVSQPRARGAIELGLKRAGAASALDRLRQSGSLKCLFPRQRGHALDAVLLNTAGGVTGGDRFDFSAHAAGGTALTLTTQACERAYRAQAKEFARVTNRLRVENGARINWLPQETILFDGSAVRRRLKIDLAAEASLLMVEPLVFGRAAMGETLDNIQFHDRIEIRREGAPLFIDAMQLSGNADAHLARSFVANGAGAMALALLVDNAAEAYLPQVQALLPPTGGASLLQSDVLMMRLLAEDSFMLRQTLMPILQMLSGDTLPRCWMI